MFRWLSLVVALLLPSPTVWAAPFKPRSDTEVVEKLPLRGPSAQRADIVRLRALRQRWQSQPENAEAAAELAIAWVEQAMTQGDPRYAGYAQSTLKPWWSQETPPRAVRLARGVVRQYGHEFKEAVSDLESVVAEKPDDVQAWSWLAAVHMANARYDKAKQACEKAAPLTVALAAAACLTHVESLTGQLDAAAGRLAQALRAAPGADPELRVWALTRLAEMEDRRGRVDAAQQAFEEALRLSSPPGAYLLAAYADFLLDQERPRDVVELLKNRREADPLLLRLAIASEMLRQSERKDLAREFEDRLKAARAQGDTRHGREAARFALELRQRPTEALAHAEANFTDQREPADARILMETALAARNKRAALPAMKWIEENGVEGVNLRSLYLRLKAMP